MGDISQVLKNARCKAKNLTHSLDRILIQGGHSATINLSSESDQKSEVNIYDCGINTYAKVEFRKGLNLPVKFRMFQKIENNEDETKQNNIKKYY